MADAAIPIPDVLATDPLVSVAPPASIDRRHETLWAENAPFTLLMILTLGLFGLLVMMNFHPVPDNSKDLMNIMLGAIVTGWVAGVNYFFGSSASAKSKDTAIATLAAKTPPATP